MPNDDSDKKAAAGWYADKRRPGEERRWDGARWLDDWRPVAQTSPAAYMVIGVLLALLAGVLTAVGFALNETLGWAVLGISGGVAGTVFNIGMIGKAVEVGVRAASR
jgi:RsiW-degrading membrane proteinase PrsW (M82 family)